MPTKEVEDILQKYKVQEESIEKQFEEKFKKEEDKACNDSDNSKQFLTIEKAKERNKTLLKDLETVKGNLRSKAIFSPTEMQWETICKRYQDEPSLPVTTWKCNLPIFV